MLTFVWFSFVAPLVLAPSPLWWIVFGGLPEWRHHRSRLLAERAKEEAEMRPSASSHAGRVARPSWFHKLRTPTGGSMRRLRGNVVYVA
jgi:hypothetical protein